MIDVHRLERAVSLLVGELRPRLLGVRLLDYLDGVPEADLAEAIHGSRAEFHRDTVTLWRAFVDLAVEELGADPVALVDVFAAEMADVREDVRGLLHEEGDSARTAGVRAMFSRQLDGRED